MRKCAWICQEAMPNCIRSTADYAFLTAKVTGIRPIAVCCAALASAQLINMLCASARGPNVQTLFYQDTTELKLKTGSVLPLKACLCKHHLRSDYAMVHMKSANHSLDGILHGIDLGS